MRSSRGWGRSSAGVNSTGCAGAVGKALPLSGVNSLQAARISSRVAFVASLMLTLSVWPSSTGTRLQCALTVASSGSTRLPLQRAQQLQRLGFELFFFVLDIGNDIAQDVERGTPG